MEAESDGGELLKLGLCLFVVPTIGWLIGAAFASGDESNLVTEMALLGYGLGGLIFLIIIGSPRLAGTDRSRMSLIFGPSARLVMLLLAGSVLVQAVLFIYSVVTLEASTIGRVHAGLMLAVGLGALAVCYALIRSAFGLFRIEPMALRGVSSNSGDLRDRVDALAVRLGAQRPDNIVLGLEPNFFVTSADVHLIGSGERLQGTTLFASLSLMRILDDQEFDAVIGHELGHFRGLDTTYSLKFAPTYSRLSHALSVLSQTSESAADLGRIPALAALSAYLTRFATSERTVGRERELIADQAGASVATSRALATALLKVGLYCDNWNWLTQQHIQALGEGRTYTQLGTTFTQVSQLSEDANWPDIRDSLAATVQAHPTDTHPSFAERVEALGLSPESFERTDCGHPSHPAIRLVDQADDLDEQLSALEANWLLAVGAAQLPQAA